MLVLLYCPEKGKKTMSTNQILFLFFASSENNVFLDQKQQPILRFGLVLKYSERNISHPFKAGRSQEWLLLDTPHIN